MNAYVVRLTGDPQPVGFVLENVARVEYRAGVAILYSRPNRNHPKYLELMAMIPLQGVTIAFGTEPPKGYAPTTLAGQLAAVEPVAGTAVRQAPAPERGRSP